MSRRRKRTRRSDQWFKVFLLIAFLIAGIASAIGFSFSGGQFDTTLFLIVFFVTLVLAVIGYFILSLPSTRGGIGEMRVSDRLKGLEKEYGGTAFHNIMIAGKDGHTSQIDHIYICTKGVFVIETKNYSGKVYGSENSEYWTEYFNWFSRVWYKYGHHSESYSFYNPVRQNEGHIRAIRNLLKGNGDLYICSVIAFSNEAELHVSVSSADITHWRYLDDTILNYKDQLLSKEQVLSITRIISGLEKTDEKISEHFYNTIKTKEAKSELIRSGRCPRCGGELVLRNGKYGKFYGCSNYPTCRYTYNPN